MAVFLQGARAKAEIDLARCARCHRMRASRLRRCAPAHDHYATARSWGVSTRLGGDAAGRWRRGRGVDPLPWLPDLLPPLPDPLPRSRTRDLPCQIHYPQH